MTKTVASASTETGSGYRGPVIDACVFHEWPTPGVLAEYMEPGWREAVVRPGDLGGLLTLKATWLYQDPFGDHRPDSYPANGVPGSDLALTQRQLLDGAGYEYAILGYKDGILATAINNYLLARAVTRAANRWTIDEWLGQDPRLCGLVLVCTSVPETAAQDIREFGAHQRMVGVALGANGLGRAFGHAVYHPIYQAAAELDLPLVIQAGSDAISSLDGTPTAGGMPATFAQYATHSHHTIMSHMSSMVVEGVFERFPNLRVLCVGGGVAWFPAHAWRMDYWFKTNAQEAPWLTRLPSEYMTEHVRLGTHPLDAPREPDRLGTALRTWPGIEQMITYTSCYPERLCEPAAGVGERLPDDWHHDVFHDNAASLFGLPAGAAPVRASGAANPNREG